ncbi:unnamed protein product, partial [Rotaria magnacalcarata]
WEDENRLNCPDLVKKFESSIEKRKHERKSCSNNESKLKNNKISKKRKNTSMQNSNEDNQNDNYQSATTEISIDSNMNEDDDADRIVTRHSKRNKTSLPTSGRRHSNRKVVQQTKRRITSMCKYILNTRGKRLIFGLVFGLFMDWQSRKSAVSPLEI